MRFRNILPAVVAALSLASCSVYRQGQTPDDVYYSPVREQDSYVAVDRNDDRYYDRNSQNGYYNPDDNYLRMRVRDRYRWSSFDNYSYMNDWQYGGGYYSPYSYNPYGMGMGMGVGFGYSPWSMYSPFSYNMYWNNYYAWNSFYNPYCPGMIVVSPKTNPVAYNNARNFRLSSYNNTYNTRNASNSRGFMNSANSSSYANPNARYNNSNNRNNSNNGNVGSSLRRVFSNSSSNNNNNSYYNPNSGASNSPVRSYQPSSSSSGSYSPSSSGSSGSSGGRSSGGGVSSSNGRSGRGG